MAINIPSSVFEVYNEALLLFTRTATLVYPAKREDCPNCSFNSLGTRTKSISIYTPGGPVPFERGMPCPYCNGRGYKEVETSEDITARIYWERKYFLDVGVAIDAPDMLIQTICFMKDYDKVNKANYLIPRYSNMDNYAKQKFQRYGQSYPQGFKQNETKYFVTFWKLANQS